MKPKPLFSTLFSPPCSYPFHSYIIILFSIFSTTTFSSSVDPRFQACEPKTCGNGQNISYPFYIIGKQQPFCGNPGFELTCGNNGFPILNLINTQYTVHEIFYNNHSIRLSNPTFSLSESNFSACVAPTQNLTVENYPFQIAPNQRGVVLFYGCESASLPERMKEQEMGCSAENRASSVVALYEKGQDLRLLQEKCKGGVVKVKVEDDDGKGGVKEALRRGFVLKWNASNCNDCKNSGGRCGFDLDPKTYTFRCYCTDRVHAVKCVEPREPEITRHKLVVIIATVCVASGFVVLIITMYFFRRRLCKEGSKGHQEFEAFLRNHGPLAVRRYSYSDLKKMANSFAEKLGQGGYGSVYKGKIHDECQVAVKVLNSSKGNGGEFINEVASISRTSHVNIVTLLGFCFEGSKRALVYEFMSNGSLEKFIYGKNPMAAENQLNCETLYQIAIGVARGLEYLHRGCNTRILHFDIKPHNILLDDNFCPKISDFGLAKICPRKESIVSMTGARGTPGYIAPEVFSRNFGGVSHKSDVYSFGMMVLEMVGGRRNINVEVECSSEIYFPHWIYKTLEKNQELSLWCIKNENDNEMVRKMILVSLWCIQTDPSARPAMSQVVDMFEGSIESLQMPPKPFLFSPRASPRSSPTHHSSSNLESVNVTVNL